MTNFMKMIFKLPYDMVGATKNGWLFFSIALESGCMVQMLNLESGRVIRRQLNFDAPSVVYSSYSLSDTGIVSALLAERDKAKVVWWRTDTLVDQ